MEPVVAGARDQAREPADVDPAARRVFAWIHVDGREHLDALQGSGHLRRKSSEPHGHAGDPGGAAAAMALSNGDRDGEGVFQGRTSFPNSTAATAWFTNSLNYYLAALFFNAFPLPQREAGARQTLRYIGDLVAHDSVGLDLSGGPVDPTPARSADSCPASG